MLKLIGALIFAANVAASAPIPLPSQSQPSPNQSGMQPAPERKTQPPNTASATDPNPQAKPFHASRYSGKNYQRNPAKKGGTNDSKPHHDLFDYLGLLLPFLVGVATVAVLIIQSLLLAKTMRATEGNTAATRRNALAAFASARAAKRSAEIAGRALTELERPFLSFSVKKTGLQVSALANVNPVGDLQSAFENIGRTPAILIEHRDNVLVVPRKEGFPPPLKPEAPAFGAAHTTVFPAGVAVGTKLNYPVTENMIRKPLEDPLWFSFAEGSGKRDHLFIYGFMRYGDIFGGEYCMGYCAIYDVLSDRFVQIGGSEYNYVRKEK